MPSYTTISEADALKFLEVKGYSCMRLDEIRDANIKGMDINIEPVSREVLWFVGLVSIFLLYKIVVTWQRIYKPSIAVYFFFSRYTTNNPPHPMHSLTGSLWSNSLNFLHSAQ